MSTFLFTLYAFLGGVILNCMPCVFPVLALKINSIVKSNDANKFNCLYYSIGVTLSMILLSCILIFLNHIGKRVGWGFQMQNPVFISISMYIMYLIGLNLSGLYDISSLNVQHKAKSRYLSEFFSGMLVTFVASPCTAPFMAPALTFAISQHAITTLLIFTSLGLGISFPYILISITPGVARLIPKPGNWMVTLKEFLSFPMYASSLWLAWVLSKQIGINKSFVVMCGFISIPLVIWIYKKLCHRYLLIPLLIISISPMIGLISTKHHLQVIQFSPQTIASLTKSHKCVFVEATADWCITCKLNHARAINRTETQNSFIKRNIPYVVSDWTNMNPSILQYIKSMNRSGVPMYVLYINASPNVLRSIISKDYILEQLQKC